VFTNGHLLQILLCRFGGLLDGVRNFVGFSESITDLSLPVSGDDQRAKAEPAAALDDLGAAIDVDDLVGELMAFGGRFEGGVRTFGDTRSAHVHKILELQSGSARGLGQRLDFSVIDETASVKNDLADIPRFGAFGEEVADSRGAGNVRALDAAPLVAGRGGDQSGAFGVINDLRIDVLAGKMDSEARTRWRAGKFPANPAVDGAMRLFAKILWHESLRF
jgi:hypothetical protein